jgi:hypothetical protein
MSLNYDSRATDNGGFSISTNLASIDAGNMQSHN